MKRRVLIIFWLCLVTAPAFAGKPAVSHFSSAFVQTRTLPGFETPLVSHGSLRFDAENGFHWEITSPYHYVFDMHDGRAREVLPDGTTRQLDPDKTPWLDAVRRIFVSALQGDRSALKQYFEMTIKPLDQGRRVTLTPKSGSPVESAIDSIVVIESAPGKPKELKIDETSGAHLDIRFGVAEAS